MRVFAVVLGWSVASHFGLIDHWYTQTMMTLALTFAFGADVKEDDE